jgi:hypothetical protein
MNLRPLYHILEGCKVSKEANQLILEITELAMKVSKNTKSSVVINYSGHVNSLNVRVFKNGWMADIDPTFEKYIHCNDENIEDLLEVKLLLVSLGGM